MAARRVVVRVVLALVALVLVAVGGVVLFLQTAAGGVFLRDRIVPRVNQQIAGQLEVAGMRLHGFRVELTGVVLRDPAGGAVAEVERLEVAVAPLALLRGWLIVDRVAIERPVLHLLSDEGGLNLARAIKARHPGEKAPADKPEDGGTSVLLRGLAVRDGLIDLRVVAPPERRHVRLEGLAIDASGAYREGGRSFDGDVKVRALVRDPLVAQLTVAAEAHGQGDLARGSLALDLGDSTVRLTVAQLGTETIALHIDRVVVQPRLVRALAPGAPGPVEALHLSGDVRRAGRLIDVGLDLAAGRGRIHAEGTLEPEDRRVRRLRVTGLSVDLSALLARGTSSSIDFSVEGQGAGKDLRSFQGEVKLAVPPSRLGARTLGPVNAHVRSNGAGYELVSLQAELPGLSVRGRGTGTPARVNLNAEVVARDLEVTSRSLLGLSSREQSPLAGSGALQVRIAGPPQAARLDAEGAFKLLRSGSNVVEDLAVQLRVVDLTRPLLVEAKLRAAHVRAGGQRLDGITIGVSRQGERGFAATIDVASPALAVQTRGQWERGFGGLELQALTLSYPEARWALVRPTRLHFGGGRFELEDLALAASGQRIEASAASSPRHLQARVLIEHLDLARLPRALLPPELGLAGRVDLELNASGSPARPLGRVALTVDRGHFRRLDRVTLKLDATYDGRHVAGKLTAGAAQAQINSRFDLPAHWPPSPGDPMELELDVPSFDVPALLVAVGATPPPGMRGRAALSAHLAGSLTSPRGSTRARLQGFSLWRQSLGDAELELAVEAPPGQTEVRAGVRVFGGEASLRVRAGLPPLRLARLSDKELLHTPLLVTATVDRLPLRPLVALASSGPGATSGGGGSGEVTAGVLMARVDGHGTALAPVVDLRLGLDGVAGRRFPATDARLEATVSDGAKGSRAEVQLVRAGRTLATLAATLRLPSARLADPAARLAAPLDVKAHFGPVRLQGIGVAPSAPHDRGHTLSGLVEADLHLDGTLGAPRLAVLVTAEDGRLDDTPIGRGELAVRYASRRPEATLLLSTIKGGNLRFSVASAVDLSYPRVLRPIDVQALPVTADLQAKDFDLAIFSGLAEPVQTVGGRLDANARVRGHVGTPQFDGRIEWSQGRLVLAGMGSYQNIHLLFHGNNEQMVLEDLSADSPTGKAKLSARAARSGGNELKFSTKIDLRSFAIYSAGQPAATLQLRGGATGTVSLSQVNVAAQIEEAHVLLPAKPPKKLQSLDRPPDVVLVANGRPIDREQAKKLRALVVQAPALKTQESAALPPPAPAPPPRPVRVEIDAPRNLWIDGPDVHAEVGLGQNFFVTLTEELRIFGTVYVRRGRLDALGKRFDLDSNSTVRFTGRPEVPILSVRANHQARKAGITIAVKIDGPANGPSITLSSPDNPQLGDTELLTVLATGHLPEERGGTSATPSDRAASLLGSVVASQLQKAVAKRLPLDVLTIEPGEGLSGTRLEAGTYLTDDVYVAYVGRIGADPLKHENSNEFQLEYQLSRRWSFEGTYGDARSGSADLVWTKHY